MSHILPTLSVTHADLLKPGPLTVTAKLQTELSLLDLTAIIVAHYTKGGHVVDPSSVKPILDTEGDDHDPVCYGFTLTLDADVTISVKMKQVK